MNKGYQGKSETFAKGGAANATNSIFYKSENQFTDDKYNTSDENWGKGSKGPKGDGGPAAPKAPKDKCLPAVKPSK